MVFLCRALSECEPEAKHELSANDTCALNEHERKRRANLVQQVYVECLVNASRSLIDFVTIQNSIRKTAVSQLVFCSCSYFAI